MNIIFAKIKEKIQKNPPGLYVLFYTEMWELFGRVGIMSILALYLTKMLHFTDAKAFAIYSAFIALLFITPIAGGILCDRFLGNRHSIVLGGIIMAIGNMLLIIPNPTMMYLGLSIIVIGNGFFLPSITPLVGYLYDDNDQGRDAGFTIFYIGKNLGYFLAPISCGIVGTYFGYNYAFVLSSLGMISGIIMFLKGRKHLQGHGKAPQKAARSKYFNPTLLIYCGALLAIPIINFALSKNFAGYLLLATGIIVLGIVISIALKRSKIERKHIFAILSLMIFVVVFSACLGQGGTTLNLFIDRIINRHILHINIPTPIFYALDPLFLFIMGPIIASIWLTMAKRKHEPNVTSKFALGLFILSFGFIIFTIAAKQAGILGQVSPLYVVLAYFIFPTAELCIVPIGLSMVTRLAPRDLGAMMVGVWMLASAAANYLTGQISKLGQVRFSMTHLTSLQHAAHIYKIDFLYTAIILAAAGVVLLLVKTQLQKLMRY